jgi:hypothetical protein
LAQLGGIDGVSGIVYIKVIPRLRINHNTHSAGYTKLKQVLNGCCTRVLVKQRLKFRRTKSKANGFWVDEKNDVLLTLARGEKAQSLERLLQLNVSSGAGGTHAQHGRPGGRSDSSSLVPFYSSTRLQGASAIHPPPHF